MTTPLLKKAFWVAAGLAAVGEGFVIYRQWPAPPVKICASIELGALLAAAAKTEIALREARAQLRNNPDSAATEEVMRMETAASAAMIDVAKYKQRVQEQQKTAAKGAAAQACS